MSKRNSFRNWAQSREGLLITSALGLGSIILIATTAISELEEERFQFNKNNPAVVEDILETQKETSGFYVGGVYNRGRLIHPYVKLEQCAVDDPDFCESITVKLPEDYMLGSIQIGDEIIANTDL